MKIKEPLYKHVALGIVLAITLVLSCLTLGISVFEREWLPAAMATIGLTCTSSLIIPFKDIFTDKPTLESRRK